MKIKSFVAAVLAVGVSFSIMSIPVSAGWVKDENDYYYETSDGSYKTGWIKNSKGDYYYCKKDGKMARNCTLKINGVSYKFDKNGKAVNKPNADSKKTSSKNDTNKKNSGAVKNQNTFPGLVTYGVYCGMSEDEFKSLKMYDYFKWDYDIDAYKVDDMYVYIEDGVVDSITRSYQSEYGYYSRSRNYISSSDAEADVASWRDSRLKTHKKKEVLLDTSTESTLTDGAIYLKTKCDNVVYYMSDVIWDTTYDVFYSIEGYFYSPDNEIDD